MPKFWLWLLAVSLFYCEMIAKQSRLDTCFCENTWLDVNCFRQWTCRVEKRMGLTIPTLCLTILGCLGGYLLLAPVLG